MSSLKQYLDAAKITQSAFAEQIGVSQGTVSKLCSNLASPSWRVAALINKETGGAVPLSAWAAGKKARQSPHPLTVQTGSEGAA